MTDPAWLSYAGAVGGLVGTITGIAGAILGYISYRRTEDLKSLDLRLELKRSENDRRRLVRGLPAHLEHAKQSRTRVAAASSGARSGAVVQWLAEWDADLGAAQAMFNALPPSSTDYSTLDHGELEAKLVASHAAFGDAEAIQEKYAGMLADDDNQRDHIRQDARARAGVRLDFLG